MFPRGYQPNKGNLDTNHPPQGGSGLIRPRTYLPEHLPNKPPIRTVQDYIDSRPEEIILKPIGDVKGTIEMDGSDEMGSKINKKMQKMNEVLKTTGAGLPLVEMVQQVSSGKLTSRKFWMTVIGTLIISIMGVYHVDVNYVYAISALLGSYMVGNGLSKKAK